MMRIEERFMVSAVALDKVMTKTFDVTCRALRLHVKEVLPGSISFKPVREHT
jgi:hypothetical protein